jgi:putative spermidine/putrescine transport system ATP-binding protein
VFELGRADLGGPVAWEGENWAVDPGTVAAHPGVRTGSAIVVRPEDVEVAGGRDAVPVGANAVRARVRDVEYLGSYRTLLLTLGERGLSGRARVSALRGDYAIGDDLVVWWRLRSQRIVAV